MQKPTDSSYCCLSECVFSGLRSAWPEHGEERSAREWILPEGHQPLKDKVLWNIQQLVRPTVDSVPWGPRAPESPLLGSNRLLSTCLLAGLLPASLPQSLMSLDSNLCIKGLLCANPLWETQKGNFKLSQNSYFFFFPNGIQQHAIIIQIENYLNLSSLVCLQWYFNISPSVTEIHKAFIQMKFEGHRKHRQNILWKNYHALPYI